jgi:hypothetical protein
MKYIKLFEQFVESISKGSYSMLKRNDIIKHVDSGIMLRISVVKPNVSGMILNSGTFKGKPIRMGDVIAVKPAEIGEWEYSSLDEEGLIKLKDTLVEASLKGAEGIPSNKRLAQLSDNDKLKIVQSTGNLISFKVPDWSRGKRNFWTVISAGKIVKKKNLNGDIIFFLPGAGPEKVSPSYSSIAELLDGVDWDTMELRRESVNETKPSINEGKYYVTYNRGRGQGKGLEMESDPKTFKPTGKPKVFGSYNDAKKYAEKMEKMFRNSIGGGTAYWVSDEKMNQIEETINEAKFKVGDKWEWVTADGTKIVSITNIKPNGDIIGKEEGSSEDFIVRDANKYLKKKVVESVNENINMPFGLQQLMADEESEGFEAEILIGRFDGNPIKAQSTDKIFSDGVPVMKNFSRGGKKDVRLKGDFHLVDSSRGWWYVYGPLKTWYAIKHDDYSTPPFEL